MRLNKIIIPLLTVITLVNAGKYIIELYLISYIQ